MNGVGIKTNKKVLPRIRPCSQTFDTHFTQVSFQTALYCWVCQMFHETSFQIINVFYRRSKPDFRVTLTLATREMVWIRCGIWRTLTDMVQLCFIKKNGQRRYQYLVLWRDISYFVKKPLWFYQKVLWNWYHQHARVFDWQNICCLVDVFFNRQSVYIWVQTVLLFSSICSFICMRQTSYRGFARKTKRS